MSTLRVTRVRAVSVPEVGSPTLRVTRVRAVSRSVSVSVTGPGTVSAAQPVRLTAVTSDGNPSGVRFTQTAGPTVNVAVANGVATFKAPTVTGADPAVLAFTVTLSRAGAPDSTATVSVTVMPASYFVLSPVSHTWEPRIGYLLQAPPKTADGEYDVETDVE